MRLPFLYVRHLFMQSDAQGFGSGLILSVIPTNSVLALIFWLLFVASRCMWLICPLSLQFSILMSQFSVQGTHRVLNLSWILPIPYSVSRSDTLPSSLISSLWYPDYLTLRTWETCPRILNSITLLHTLGFSFLAVTLKDISNSGKHADTCYWETSVPRIRNHRITGNKADKQLN